MRELLHRRLQSQRGGGNMAPSAVGDGAMPDASTPPPRRSGCARRVVIFVPVVGALVALASIFVARRVAVPADVTYMAPELQPGQAAWIDKLSLRIAGPRRGDVVAVRAPNGRRGFVILRLVALPGETVELRGGRVLLEGAPLAESYARGDVPMSFGPQQVARDHYFVLADDRRAYASRRILWGLVARRDILGRVLPAGA